MAISREKEQSAEAPAQSVKMQSVKMQSVKMQSVKMQSVLPDFSGTPPAAAAGTLLSPKPQRRSTSGSSMQLLGSECGMPTAAGEFSCKAGEEPCKAGPVEGSSYVGEGPGYCSGAVIFHGSFNPCGDCKIWCRMGSRQLGERSQYNGETFALIRESSNPWFNCLMDALVPAATEEENIDHLLDITAEVMGSNSRNHKLPDFWMEMSPGLVSSEVVKARFVDTKRPFVKMFLLLMVRSGRGHEQVQVVDWEAGVILLLESGKRITMLCKATEEGGVTVEWVYSNVN